MLGETLSMPQGIKGWALFTIAQVFLTVAWKWVIKLGEHAVLGWGDEQIGHVFGISSPALTTVIAWGFPIVLAAGTLILYHVLILKRLPEERIASTQTTQAHSAVLAPANYSRAQINRILEAIDSFYPALVEIENALVFGSHAAGSLEAIIRDKGAAELLNTMDQLRLRLIDPADRLDREIQKYSLYSEVCRIVSDNKSLHDAFFAAYNDLATILREIPEKLSAPALAIFVEAKKQTFVARNAEYLGWAIQKKKALAEYREWYLRRPTTD